jgi:Zn-dependent protease/CBS domain-containing protein
MKWSFHIGTFFGIPVNVHLSFLLLPAWVAMVSWQQSHSVAAVVTGIIYILSVFVCVVLHEFGHALTARRYGIRTRDVTLLPIGGVARLERMPDDPRQELWVALAGPAVNVVIAGVLLGVAKAMGDASISTSFAVSAASFVGLLIFTNLMLVAFNLLPAFPMDGGRVLRALLATRMAYARATRVAASIGQTMAFLFALVGLFGIPGLYAPNPLLILVAFFVWIGAAQESRIVQIQRTLSGVTVAQAMLTDFRTLAPGDTLATAIELTLTGTQRDFPVVDAGRIEGVLEQGDLLAALARGGPDTRVADVMRREFERMDVAEDLVTAFQRLRMSSSNSAPVMTQDRLVGLVTRENVGELLAIRGALQHARWVG